MDIPAVRFLLPCFVLYAFYWCLSANPWVDEFAGKDPEHQLSNERAQNLLGRTRELIRLERYQDALKPALQLFKAYPESSIYIEQLATIHHKLQQWKEEAEMWEQFMVHAPMPVEGCPQIGVAYRKLQMEEKAAQSFERCLQIEENSDNLLFMGSVLERKGEYAKADELYGRAIKRAPEYSDVIIGKARVELRIGKAAASKKRILELLDRQPDNADALLVAGMACLKLGDASEARTHLNRGRRVRPTDADFGVMLAQVSGRRYAGTRQ